MIEGGLPEANTGTEGYPTDTPGYPDPISEDVSSSGESLGIDLSIYRDPRELARTNLIASDQPLAQLGLAGWAEFGLSRTTMARLLVVRGARETIRKAGERGDPQD